MATVTMVAAGRHIHGEVSATRRRRFVQGTTSVPFVARSLARLEAEQVEYLLHGDLRAKPVEIDAWHGFDAVCGFDPREEWPFRSLLSL